MEILNDLIVLQVVIIFKKTLVSDTRQSINDIFRLLLKVTYTNVKAVEC